MKGERRKHRDEPNRAIIQEVPQGNSLFSCLKQAKMSFFSCFFSYTKLENRSVEQVWSRGAGTDGKAEGVGKW
jgi:hypothetical protein